MPINQNIENSKHF